MAKGKWAQGIEPRNMRWFIKNRLAICERPGGYGPDHRKVRRQEEVIWLRESDYAFVVSLIPSDHNLHTYDEYGMPWKHWPFSPSVDLEISLPVIYSELQRLLADDKKLLLHLEEVGDRLAGFLGGYLRWTQIVPNTCQAIIVAENILERQLGPEARTIITAAGEIADAANAETNERKPVLAGSGV